MSHLLGKTPVSLMVLGNSNRTHQHYIRKSPFGFQRALFTYWVHNLIHTNTPVCPKKLEMWLLWPDSTIQCRKCPAYLMRISWYLGIDNGSLVVRQLCTPRKFSVRCIVWWLMDWAAPALKFDAMFLIFGCLPSLPVAGGHVLEPPVDTQFSRLYIRFVQK